MMAFLGGRNHTTRRIRRPAGRRVLPWGLLLGCLACDGTETIRPDAPVGRVVIQLGGTNPFGMNVGVSIDLTAEVFDSMGAKVTPQPTVTFQSTAPGVVTTTAGGHLTALAPGSAYVRAEVSGDRRFRPDSVAILVFQPL
jgi:hypothetical protein